MNRRSFAHTERPAGSPTPTHRSPALDTLMSLTKRGGADVQAEQLQKPMPNKPPSPVALEALRRVGQQRAQQMPQQMPPAQQMAPPMQMPMEMPMEQPMAAPAEQPVMEQPFMEPEEDNSWVPPYDGYWGEMLDKIIQQRGGDPMLEQASNRFKEIRASLQRIKEYVNQMDSEIRNA